MPDSYKIPLDASLTDKVLYAILPHPDKFNEQIADNLRENESDGETESDGDTESDGENESE